MFIMKHFHRFLSVKMFYIAFVIVNNKYTLQNTKYKYIYFLEKEL
jgi:hypothetical protein